MNYLSAIKRPFTNLNKFLIGFIFLVVPILNIVTGFFVKGYQLECGRTALKKSSKLPDWNNFLKLFVDGLLATVIGIIYLLPFIIFLLLTLGDLIISLIKTKTTITEELVLNSVNSFTIPGLIITLVLFLLGIYLIPIAIMNFISKCKFKDAFNLILVFKKAFRGKYFLVVLFIIAYSLLIIILSGLITYLFSLFAGEMVLLVTNNILSAITNFIIGITGITLVGEIYQKL